MRGTLMARIISVAVAMSLLSAGAATAQVREPAPTPPPRQFRGVTTAVIRNALTDSNINAVIEETAKFAHREIGGRVGGKKDGFLSVTLPDPASVSIAAGDLAQEDFHVAVISGGDSLSTVGIASANPTTVFLDIDQALPCVTKDGIPDPSGTCAGGRFAIPQNYTAVDFAVDQPAYLAGVIAAAASRDDMIGIISGMPGCEECNRYIEGFQLGAQSVKPEIGVELAYLADEGAEAAFGDPAAAKTFAKAFIDVYEPDVLLPVTGSSSRGIIEAACEAGIFAVGTELDMSAVYPDLEECLLSSITKDIGYAVRESVFGFANEDLGPLWELGLDDGHVAVTDEWTRLPGLPVDLTERYENAEQAILTGQVDTCPTACGLDLGPGPSDGPADGGGGGDVGDGGGGDVGDDAEEDGNP